MATKTSWLFIQEVELNTNPETGEREAINVCQFLSMKNGKYISMTD